MGLVILVRFLYIQLVNVTVLLNFSPGLCPSKLYKRPSPCFLGALTVLLLQPSLGNDEQGSHICCLLPPFLLSSFPISATGNLSNRRPAITNPSSAQFSVCGKASIAYLRGAETRQSFVFSFSPVPAFEY